MRAVVAETGRLDHREQGLECVGVYTDLKLASVPELRHLLVCSQIVRVRTGQTDASQPGDCPTVSFSGLEAAFLAGYNGLELNSGEFAWGSGYRRHSAKLQYIFSFAKPLTLVV